MDVNSDYFCYYDTDNDRVKKEKKKETKKRMAAKIKTSQDAKAIQYQLIKQKIGEIIVNDPSLDEICLHAGITRNQYSALIKREPAWAEQLSIYRASAKHRARSVVIDAINQGDVTTSKWYLERKAKDEFGDDNKQTGQITINITQAQVDDILTLDVTPDETFLLDKSATSEE